MLIIHPIIFDNDFDIFCSNLPVEQSKQPIEHDRYAEIEHKREDDRADEILECHVGLK